MGQEETDRRGGEQYPSKLIPGRGRTKVYGCIRKDEIGQRNESTLRIEGDPRFHPVLARWGSRRPVHAAPGRLAAETGRRCAVLHITTRRNGTS